MKILLVNQPLRNRGDESAHKALLRAILNRMSNVQIRVLFVGCTSTYSISQFSVDDNRVEYINLHPFWRYSKISGEALVHSKRQFFWLIHPSIRQIIAHYKWADLVVCAPGGICMGGFQDWNHLFFLKMAQYMHKKIAYYGRSIGPFSDTSSLSKRFREISYEMLNYFSYLSLRDKKSEEIAEKIGVPYISTVDTAFLDTPNVDLPYEILEILRGKQYMVFVPNYLLWHYKYKTRFNLIDLIDFYSEVIRLIWNKYPNVSIVMLPQTFDQGGLNDDINLFRLIATQLNDSRVIVMPDCYSSDVQQTIISQANFVIGARYHSIVFAINNNIPFISLSYEHKMSGLLETLNLIDNQVDFSEVMFSSENIQKCLQTIEKAITKLQKNDAAQKLAKQIAASSFQEFINFTQRL